MTFDVIMGLGSPPLNERREVFANADPLTEEAARVLCAELAECVGTSGIGVDGLTLLDVEVRERK